LRKQDDTFKRIEVSKNDAFKYFKERGDQYKVELIEDLEDGTITYYQHADFTDFAAVRTCRRLGR
jgi:threonyl-tRNA synthetase